MGWDCFFDSPKPPTDDVGHAITKNNIQTLVILSRMEGLPALILWEIIAEVVVISEDEGILRNPHRELGGSHQTSNTHRFPYCLRTPLG